MFSRRWVILAPLALMACGQRNDAAQEQPSPAPAYDAPLYPNETPELRALIVQYAEHHEIPVELLQRVIVRESTHRPWARNGPYYGLMQILPATARSMGYEGPPEGLLDAETNLRYAGRYLRGAWLLADGSYDRAVQLYASGYYYVARDRGMLEEVGLR